MNMSQTVTKVFVKNTLIRWNTLDRDRRTCPPGITIKASGISFDKLGAWAEKDFAEQSVFGPFEGVKILQNESEKLASARIHGFVREIFKNGRVSHYLDGANKTRSNWLKYINCARILDEQNEEAFQHLGKLYYLAVKKISSGTEILARYDRQCAEQLERSEETEERPDIQIGQTDRQLEAACKEMVFVYHDKYKLMNMSKTMKKVFVRNTLIRWNTLDRDQRTCPPGITIKASGISSDRLGAWAEKDFAEQSVFGPFEGVKILQNESEKLASARIHGFVREIFKNGRVSHYLDGSNKTRSNWLKYINCARILDEQNAEAFQHRDKLYYLAVKKISSGTEILARYEQISVDQLERSEETQERPDRPDRPIGQTDRQLEAEGKDMASTEDRACDKFEEVSANTEALNQHEKDQHVEKTVTKQHQCEYCDYSTNNAEIFGNHMATHYGERPYVCEICDKRFRKKSYLTAHKDIHVVEKKYACVQCPQKFATQRYLNKHIDRLHRDLLYQCYGCPLRFRRLKRLTRHMQAYPFACRHKCKICDKKFKCERDLEQHELIHTGKRPYICEDCPSTFRTKKNYRAHCSALHNEKLPYKCSYCQMGFFQSCRLQNHEECCYKRPPPGDESKN
ncbi:unnamed protein product [Clavelina lepadiformis]|uniref:Uncharacterized protein n=1 Tax=Clavelina lepadiformis TaxID=159417 RepID=A0ABP0GV55_CLALP